MNPSLSFTENQKWAIYSANWSREIGDDDARREVNESAFSANYSAAIAMMQPVEYSEKFRTARLWWCKHIDPRATIGELGIGLHFGGTVSIMVVPRVGKAEMVKAALDSANVSYHSHIDENAIDRRAKFLVVVPAENTAQADPFLNVVHSLSPLDTAVKQFFQQVMTYASTELDYQYFTDTALNDVELPDCRGWFNFPVLTNIHAHYRICANKMMGSSIVTFRRYESDIHRHFPEGRTALTRALCDNDLDEITRIITTDPNSVLRTDGFGGFPVMMALYRNKDVFRLIYRVASEVAQTNCPGLREQVGMMAMHTSDEAYERFAGLSPEFDAVWLGIEASGYVPTRPELHKACAEGDIEKVRAILNVPAEKIPGLLYECDRWGLSPLVIAAGEGNAALLEILLECRDAHYDKDLANNNSHLYGLLQNAKGRECLLLLLKYGIDANEQTTCVHECIRTDDLERLKLFYRYGRDEIQDDTGYAPIDTAILRACETGNTDLLEWLLQQCTNHVIAGPYDSSIAATVAEMLVKHNEKIDESLKQKETRPKVRDIELVRDEDNTCQLRTRFVYNNQAIVSSIKSTADLTNDGEHSEVEQIYKLYYKAFSCRFGDSPKARREFFDEIFPRYREASVFVDVCKIGDRVISYSAFEIKNSTHESCGDFQFFYGKLAGIDPDFAALGLANFIFRIPLGIKMFEPKTPLFVYYTAIRPGFSWQMVPSVDCRVYPKYHENEDLVSHVVDLAGETLTGPGKIAAILRVNREAPRTDAIAEFEELAGDDENDVIPVFWTVSTASTQAYIHKLQYNSVTPYTIAFTADRWQTMYAEHLALLSRMQTPQATAVGIGSHYATLNANSRPTTSAVSSTATHVQTGSPEPSLQEKKTISIAKL